MDPLLGLINCCKSKNLFNSFFTWIQCLDSLVFNAFGIKSLESLVCNIIDSRLIINFQQGQKLNFLNQWRRRRHD